MSVVCCDDYKLLMTFAAFHWARELVFIRNKLIMFTIVRELSH